MMNRSHRFARKAIKAAQARDMVIGHARQMDAAYVPLGECLHRRIAEALFAKESLPHFRRSGLDGYAIVSADAAQAAPQRPAVLPVIDEVPAGSVSARQVVPGTAIRIMTGAAVPEGADAVVMFEQTEEFHEGGQTYVRIKHQVAHGQHIAGIGDELAAGRLLAGRGTLIGPGQMALLASCGYERVPVIRQPKVGVLTTGSELTAVGQPLQPGKIRNSNACMLLAQIAQCGGQSIDCGTAPDRLDEVARVLENALAECDMLLVSGGVSVGDYDVMAAFFTAQGRKAGAVESGGLELLFNKIAMRPGSPTTAAVWNGKLVFGLSGNPGACFVGFELFVRPALLAMQGVDDPGLPVVQAVLTENYEKGCPHDRYIRGRMTGSSGQVCVSPLPQNSSSMLVSIQDANCLIRIPSGSRGAASGERVEAYLLPYEMTLYGKRGD